MDLNVLGMTLRTVNFGMNHQSNGRAEPLSRSWNRIVANLGFERTGLFSLDDSLVLELKSWYRIPEDTESDDNPDIEDYLGYGEIWASYFRNKNRFSMMVRNNLDDDENRGAIQLEWSFPLNNRISGYLLYYLGYGESLLDYNHSVNRVGLGFVLTDWA
jgi:phospholipase A1